MCLPTYLANIHVPLTCVRHQVFEFVSRQGKLIFPILPYLKNTIIFMVKAFQRTDAEKTDKAGKFQLTRAVCF